MTYQYQYPNKGNRPNGSLNRTKYLTCRQYLSNKLRNNEMDKIHYNKSFLSKFAKSIASYVKTNEITRQVKTTGRSFKNRIHAYDIETLETVFSKLFDNA